MTYYIIYKITNLINGKFYIGKHATEDVHDDYMGSGIIMKKAHQEYGIHNFKKEILFIFNNKTEMENKEHELVTREFIEKNNTYNTKSGGKGSKPRKEKPSGWVLY